MIYLRRKHPRAFATLMAVALIGIVGAVLASLTAMFAADLKRSALQTDDAQLRQLLIAGEIVARESTKTGPVDLPEELTGDGIKLTSEAAGENRIRLVAHNAHGRSAAEIVQFSRDGDHLSLLSAELE